MAWRFLDCRLPLWEKPGPQNEKLPLVFSCPRLYSHPFAALVLYIQSWQPQRTPIVFCARLRCPVQYKGGRQGDLCNLAGLWHEHGWNAVMLVSVR